MTMGSVVPLIVTDTLAPAKDLLIPALEMKISYMGLLLCRTN